jgi:hypothetical protein
VSDEVRRPDGPAPAPARLLSVAAAYVAAFASIILFSMVAAGVVRELYPDLSEREVLDGFPGLLAGGIASSLALACTTLLAATPVDPRRLRLRPGWETGRALGVMLVGTLALGQALDSLTTLAGLDQQGALVAIRRALAGAGGPDLVAAVLVIGGMAGTAEELFFRGYMQGRLAERLSPWSAIVVTSAAFGFLHLEWLHALLAFALGLWLGWLTELTGSALPAMACHVVNNALFTLLTARFGALDAPGPNAALLVAGVVVSVACVVWLRRAAPAR